MANLTDKGEQYVLKLLQGGWSGGTLGYDRIGLYGSTGGAADSLLDGVKNITWAWTAGNSSIFMNQDPLFAIPANTVVKGVMLFNSVEGVTIADALSQYILETPRTFVNSGTVEVESLTYNFDRIQVLL